MDIAPYVSLRIVFCILDDTFFQSMIKGPALTAPIKCLAIPFARPLHRSTFFCDGRLELFGAGRTRAEMRQINDI